MIPIDEEFRKYLRFSFDNSLYEFNCLPFGLNTAPYVFTKIMKPVISYLRNLGFLLVIYLDDLLLLSNTYSDCLRNIKASVEFLEKIGFIINEEKSCKIPSQTCTFLGFILNSRNMTLELSQEKRQKLQNQIKIFKKLDKCKIREFAQLIGSLVSCCPAIKYSWAHVKNLEREKYLELLRTKGNYEAVMHLARDLQSDFAWWELNVLHRNSSLASRSFRFEIFLDASLTGWGISCGTNRTHGLWNESERLHHINYLELLSAFFGLKCFAKDLRNCDILLRIDNTTAIAYINRMGGVRFKKLSDLAKTIWKWCEERELFIFASYISSKDNAVADFESRRLDKETEFEISDVAFRKIVKRLGNHILFGSRLPWWPGYYQENLLAKRYSREIRENHYVLLSESSLKQYDCSLKKWWRYCKEKNKYFYETEITDIIKFLTEEFNKGASYGSLNNMRSAISLILGPEVGQNELIKRFFKGLFRLKPPKPKYESTWNSRLFKKF
ncbi:uncharacterized protein [Anoplolepis gracilipes]|uniref:uncharacterized protein n=1 Tax=Anoplolepis gracilipes TaxID=354296 RepID=UPI003BA0BE28